MSIKVNQFVIQADIKDESPAAGIDSKRIRTLKKEIIEECMDQVRQMLRRESDR